MEYEGQQAGPTGTARGGRIRLSIDLGTLDKPNHWVDLLPSELKILPYPQTKGKGSYIRQQAVSYRPVGLRSIQKLVYSLASRLRALGPRPRAIVCVQST